MTTDVVFFTGVSEEDLTDGPFDTWDEAKQHGLEKYVDEDGTKWCFFIAEARPPTEKEMVALLPAADRLLEQIGEMADDEAGADGEWPQFKPDFGMQLRELQRDLNEAFARYFAATDQGRYPYKHVFGKTEQYDPYEEEDDA